MAGEQKGIGACAIGFTCCGTTLQTPGLTDVQKQCIRRYNSTGLITQDGACAQTLVAQNVVSQGQVVQTAGEQAIADVGLKFVISSVEGAANTFEKSQIMAKAYQDGKISLQEYIAASAYYGLSATIDLATGGGETRFQNSLAYSHQECAKEDNAVNCAAAAIGAGANGFIAVGGTFMAVDQVIGSPLTSTVVNSIPNKAATAADAANSAENAAIRRLLGLSGDTGTGTTSTTVLGQLDSSVNIPGYTNSTLPCVLGSSTDPDSIAFEGAKGKVLGCRYDPVKDALSYNVGEGVIYTADGTPYSVGDQVGSGAYSTVYDGESKTVLKIFNDATINNNYAYDSALSQAEFLLDVKKDSGYPNIVRIIVDSEDPALLRGLEMEKVTGTNLGDYLAQGNTLTQDQADSIVSQLQSVQVNTGRAHGDVAVSGQLVNPDNIIIQPNGKVTFLDPAGLGFTPLDASYVMNNELNSLSQGLQQYVR